MQNSVHTELASPLAVVAHDAGAANLIIGWLRMRRDLDIRTCLAGPAVELWTAAFGKPQILLPTEALLGAATLLSGTSYASDLEHKARAISKERGIRSIGVLDHWVNYPDRFMRDGRQVLPEEIWVVDEDAMAIAVACFPGISVQQQPNLYLADLIAQVRAAAIESRPDAVQRVLYVLEPIRHAWAEGGVAGEIQALDYFIQCGALLGLDRSTDIRLRPHPSDPPGKYTNWLARNNGWNLRLDPNKNLAKSIAWADTVAGCETFALIVGIGAGRRVVSTLPPQAPVCRLPTKEIIHLRDLTPLNLLGPAS